MIGTARYLIALGRKSIKSNLDWGDSYEKITGLKGELANQNEHSIVDPGVSKDEFAERFFHLSMAKYACLAALVFSLTKAVLETSLSGQIVSVGAALICTIMFMQFSFRSWVAEYVWTNWEKRLHIKRPRYSKFIQNVVSSPIVLFSIKLN